MNHQTWMEEHTRISSFKQGDEVTWTDHRGRLQSGRVSAAKVVVDVDHHNGYRTQVDHENLRKV